MKEAEAIPCGCWIWLGSSSLQPRCPRGAQAQRLRGRADPEMPVSPALPCPAAQERSRLSDTQMCMCVCSVFPELLCSAGTNLLMSRSLDAVKDRNF